MGIKDDSRFLIRWSHDCPKLFDELKNIDNEVLFPIWRRIKAVKATG